MARGAEQLPRSRRSEVTRRCRDFLQSPCQAIDQRRVGLDRLAVGALRPAGDVGDRGSGGVETDRGTDGVGDRLGHDLLLLGVGEPWIVLLVFDSDVVETGDRIDRKLAVRALELFEIEAVYRAPGKALETNEARQGGDAKRAAAP